MPPPSPRHTFNCQSGKRDPVETFDNMSKRLEHSAHFSVSTFKKRNENLRTLRSWNNHHLFGFRDSILQVNAAFQLLQILIRKAVPKPHAIHPFDLILWMHHCIGKLTVVRKQEDPCRVSVQAANRIDPIVDLDVVHDCRPALLIAEGRDAVLGFVEEDVVDFSLNGDKLAIDYHAVGVRVDFDSQLADDPAVDLHGAGKNQFIILTTGAYTSEREKSV